MSPTVNGPLSEVLTPLCILLSRRGLLFIPIVFLELPLAIGAQSNSSDDTGDMECCLDEVDRLRYSKVRVMLLRG